MNFDNCNVWLQFVFHNLKIILSLHVYIIFIIHCIFYYIAFNLITLYLTFVQESDDIPPDSYCRMEHVVTGQWLHGGSGKRGGGLYLLSHVVTSS